MRISLFIVCRGEFADLGYARSAWTICRSLGDGRFGGRNGCWHRENELGFILRFDGGKPFPGSAAVWPNGFAQHFVTEISNRRLARWQTVLREQFSDGAERSPSLPQLDDDFPGRQQVFELLLVTRRKFRHRFTVCQTREIVLSTGDRLHLKANRKLTTGDRVTNGELVAVKSVHSDGAVELADGRVLDKSYREILPGYAVTSYGSQGKTVDHVLFSDSTIRAATNAQQWYVTISRGRRGIRIFTPDKQQLRENIMRPGHRPLAMEMATGFVPRRNNRLWNRLHGYMLRFGRRAADNFVRLTLPRRHRNQIKQKYERKITRMLGE
jgi:hypothetical protein